MKSIARRRSLGAALPCLIVVSSIVSSGCGGSSEPAESPSPPRAANQAPPAAEATAATEPEPSDSPPKNIAPSSEVASVVEGPTEPASEAAASNRLASELEKRRKAAKAQSGEDEEESKPKEAEVEEPAAPAYKGPEPCRAATFHLDRVRQACESGGRVAAKRVMKDAITKAIAMSQSLKCTNCHVNQKDYELKPNAVEDLKRWLEGS